MAVHSQLLECSASEVHAMVEGATLHRPGTPGSPTSATRTSARPC